MNSSAPPGPAHSSAPPPSFQPEAVARPALLHYLYEYDVRSDHLPKGIDPALVERVLLEETDRARPAPGPAGRMVDLADFYGTRGVVPRWQKELDRKEVSGAAYLTSVAFTRGVGLLGDAAAAAFARQYQAYLLQERFAEQHMGALLDSVAAIAPPQLDTTTLAARIDVLAKGLAVRAQTDPAAGTEQREMEDLKTNTLARMAAALSYRDAIVAEPDPAARLDRTVALYLGTDMAYHETLLPWSTHTLLEEGRAGRSAEVIASFRRAIAHLASGADPRAEALIARSVHAVELFGGTLSTDEKKAVRPENKRADLLSTDGP